MPKKPNAKGLNDLRPIALTSQLMKCFERVILCHFSKQVAAYQDPLQFAYRESVGVDDALLYLLHRVYSHLETAGKSVRIMFFDFSSAFNTIQPHILAKKLIDFNMNNSMVAWVMDYLTSRPQYVRLGGGISKTVITNTGAPQGTVLSPFLFSLYTSDCRISPASGCHLQKFSDDSALVGYITEDSHRAYQQEVDLFVKWCEDKDNHLMLNISKTKELIIDFRLIKAPFTPVLIKGEEIEVVPSYKYLGVLVDSKLDWRENSSAMFKKAQSRLFFLRKLHSFNVSRPLLHMFYQSILVSVMFYAVVLLGERCKN